MGSERGDGGRGPGGPRAASGGIRFFAGLRSRLVALVVLALLPALALLVHTGLQRREDALRGAEEAALGLSRIAARCQEEAFDEARQVLSALALLPPVRDLDPDRAGPLLATLLEGSPGYLNFGIIGRDGRILASALPSEEVIDLSDRAYFRNTLARGRFAVGRYQVGRITGRASINVGLPLGDTGAGPRAVLFAALDLEWLRDLSRRVPLPEGSALLVLDEAGTLVVRIPEGGGARAGERHPAEDLLLGVRGSGNGMVAAGGNDGVRRRFGFTALRSGGEATGATVAVGLPESAVVAEAESDLHRSLLLAGTALLAAVAGSWLFGSRFIIRRVNALMAATRRLGSGDLEFRARARDRQKEPTGEFSHLEKAFDDMARSLEDRTRDLREAEARYRELVEGMPAVLYLARAEEGFSLEYVSPQIRALTGQDAGEGSGGRRRWEEFVHPADRERVAAARAAAVAEGRPFVEEYRVVAPDGRETWVRDVSAAVEDGGERGTLVRGFLVDVTERKDLERQFLHAQKMEAVGRLAAGVAHDFNNLLTVIAGYGQILQGRFRGDPASLEAVREIQGAADRAAELTRQLLSFSRGKARDPVLVDLDEALAALRPMIGRLVGERIAIDLRADGGLERIRVDRGQVDQVVMNLVVNARDAMAEGGRLSLRTGSVRLDEEYVRRHVDVRPGRYVCLTVEDNGCGMEERVRERIFEPFFTTKAEGKGTGLGLSTVYGIVRQAGGHVEVYSAPWRGTTFKIYFPRAEGAAAGEAEPRPAPAAAGQGRTILLVEDDPVIRALAREVLGEAGHRVLEADSLAAARRVAAGHGGVVDLLLTDIGLPDGNGRDLVRELAPSRPEMRTVIISGFGDDPVPGEEPLPARVVYLPKPFGPKELQAVVARSFD